MVTSWTCMEHVTGTLNPWFSHHAAYKYFRSHVGLTVCSYKTVLQRDKLSGQGLLVCSLQKRRSTKGSGKQKTWKQFGLRSLKGGYLVDFLYRAELAKNVPRGGSAGAFGKSRPGNRRGLRCLAGFVRESHRRRRRRVRCGSAAMR